MSSGREPTGRGKFSAPLPTSSTEWAFGAGERDESVGFGHIARLLVEGGITVARVVYLEGLDGCRIGA